MSQTVIRTIAQLFSSVNGNAKYTKAYCQEHPGSYIVYTGTTIGTFAKVDFADYCIPSLTFTTDGENAGTVQYIDDDRYSIGGHRTMLIPIDEKIDLKYFQYILQPLFAKKVKRGDVPSIRFNMVKDLTVELPALSDGSLDLEKQKELALKYQDIEEKKRTLIKKMEILKESSIVFDDNNSSTYTKIKFNEMFKLKRGKIISKNDIVNHPGEFPVYSTQRGVYGYFDTYMYDGEYLLWNTDGLAGYIKKTQGKFSLTNIVGIMLPTNKVDMSKVCLDYIRIYLEPIFRGNRKGRLGINGKNEYTKLNSTMITKLNIEIPIPIKSNGAFDLIKQQELANKHAKIASIKSELSTDIKNLLSFNITP